LAQNRPSALLVAALPKGGPTLGPSRPSCGSPDPRIVGGWQPARQPLQALLSRPAGRDSGGQALARSACRRGMGRNCRKVADSLLVFQTKGGGSARCRSCTGEMSTHWGFLASFAEFTKPRPIPTERCGSDPPPAAGGVRPHRRTGGSASRYSFATMILCHNEASTPYEVSAYQ
jgi:hypothetical protein